MVRAFDADQINKVLYIVMEYVPGHSLAERLKKGPIPPAEMVDYAAQAALGLAHAPRAGNRASRHQAFEHSLDRRSQGQNP